VAAVRELWDRSGRLAGQAIGEQLSAFAEALMTAHVAGEPAAAVLINFTAWSFVQGECDPTFERAVDAAVMGRLQELKQLLAHEPDRAAGVAEEIEALLHR
jgi:hypothetical protein